MLMRLTAVVFTAILAAAPAQAQEALSSSAAQPPSTSQDDKDKKPASNLPVSLDKIKKELDQPPALRGLNERPTFQIEIHEKPKVSLDDLLKSLDFKAGPVPAGGVYAAELQRQAFPATNNPLAQPYAAFNQGELLTILVENLVGKYLAGKASNAITGAMRDHAVAAARDEVQQAVVEYCAAQPNRGAGIQICDKPVQ